MNIAPPLIWIAIFAIGLTYEFWAILHGKHDGDTLSEQVWWLNKKWWGRIGLFPLWVWLTWHFFVEPEVGNLHTYWQDDIILVAVGIITAIFTIKRKLIKGRD